MRRMSNVVRGPWPLNAAPLYGLLALLLPLTFSPPARAADDNPVWRIIHSNSALSQPECQNWKKRAHAPKGGTPLQLLDLELGMSDVDVVCALFEAYGKKDVPLWLLERYTPAADQIYRSSFRDRECVPGGGLNTCIEESVERKRGGTRPDQTSEPRRRPDDGSGRPNTLIENDWSNQDVTLMEFEWTPCTAFLVQREYGRWKAKHLNQISTGVEVHTDRERLKLDPGTLPQLYGRRWSDPAYRYSNSAVQTGPQREQEAWPFGQRPALFKQGATQQEKREADEYNVPGYKNVCLNSVTVRTAIRDRWANYVHVQFREHLPVEKASGNATVAEAASEAPSQRVCPLPSDATKTRRLGLDFCKLSTIRSLRYEPADENKPDFWPRSSTTEIQWKSKWLNRDQWLVLVRDHFKARLEAQKLNDYQCYDTEKKEVRLAKYALPDPSELVPAELVDKGPAIRYPAEDQPRQSYHWRSADPEDAFLADSEYKEVIISFEPEASLVISRGALYRSYWDRAQTRFVAREAEWLGRYETAAPLIQNDLIPDSRLPNDLSRCEAVFAPLPEELREAEIPPRNAVTPRFGPVYEGPPLATKAEAPPDAPK